MSSNKLFNVVSVITVGGLFLLSPPMLHSEKDNFETSAKVFYANILEFKKQSLKNNIESVNSQSLSFGYKPEKQYFENIIMYNNINGFPIGNNTKGIINNINDCVYIWNTFSKSSNSNIVFNNSYEEINYEKNTIYIEFYKQVCEFKYNNNNIAPLKKIIYDAENTKIEFKNFFNKGDINV